MKSLSVTIQMKATEQYFPVVLFIILYKVVLTFESVDEILKCDHSNESYPVLLSCDNSVDSCSAVTFRGTASLFSFCPSFLLPLWLLRQPCCYITKSLIIQFPVTQEVTK